MNRFIIHPIGVFLFVFHWAWVAPAAVSLGQDKLPYKSPLGLAVDKEGKTAYVALHTAGTVAVVDVPGGKLLKEWPVGKGPNDLVLSGGKLYVTCEHDDCVVILDAVTGKQEAKFAVGQGPQGVAINEGKSRLFVPCRDDQSLICLSTNGAKIRSVKVKGWPTKVSSLGNDKDSDELGVEVLSSLPGKALVTFAFDSPEKLQVQELSEHIGVTNVRGYWGRVAALQKPNPSIPVTQISQGWVFQNCLSHLNHGGGIATAPLDLPTKSQADPSDILVQTGDWVYVTCGADQVLFVGVKELWEKGWGFHLPGSKYSKLKPNQAYNPEDMTLHRKFVIAALNTGTNPRRMALSGHGKTLVVANYLGDSLTVIDVAKRKVTKTISLNGPPPDAARRGEILFNSARLTQFGQFTCASCHPNGGSDGLNWDLPRDGIGNPMNTRSLLGVKDTAPYGWHGTSATLADRVYGTLTTLHGYEPTTDEVADLVAYLETLPPPRPLPKKLLNQDKVARGKALFHGKAACAGCHAGPTLQDSKTHNIGTARPMDISPKFDTPSLRGVVYTAPYLHDGSAETLPEIFTKRDPQKKHGEAHELNASELADLVEFLRSL